MTVTTHDTSRKKNSYFVNVLLFVEAVAIWNYPALWGRVFSLLRKKWRGEVPMEISSVYFTFPFFFVISVSKWSQVNFSVENGRRRSEVFWNRGSKHAFRKIFQDFISVNTIFLKIKSTVKKIILILFESNGLRQEKTNFPWISKQKLI